MVSVTKGGKYVRLSAVKVGYIGNPPTARSGPPSGNEQGTSIQQVSTLFMRLIVSFMPTIHGLWTRDHKFCRYALSQLRIWYGYRQWKIANINETVADYVELMIKNQRISTFHFISYCFGVQITYIVLYLYVNCWNIL